MRLELERFGYLVLGVAFLVDGWRWSTGSAEGCTASGAEGSCWPPAPRCCCWSCSSTRPHCTQVGSPELVLQVRSAQDWVRDQLGGVPHPVEALVGIPALVWGVSMRYRRRQGWWVCAFGATATAAVTTGCSRTDVFTMEAVLAAAYSSRSACSSGTC